MFDGVETLNVEKSDLAIFKLRQNCKNRKYIAALWRILATLAVIVVHSIYRVTHVCLSDTPLRCTCVSERGGAST